MGIYNFAMRYLCLSWKVNFVELFRGLRPLLPKQTLIHLLVPLFIPLPATGKITCTISQWGI